ncbi:hypothetical protein BDC45DRAFT_519376 [Circinella umbellata]|nr:hypothetical protein BDC45DRAFT_519376 [Circinella umbellata]
MIPNAILSLKRAHFHPEDYNSNARFEWATEILKADIEYWTNCVFIDESSFKVNMKRSMV